VQAHEVIMREMQGNRRAPVLRCATHAAHDCTPPRRRQGGYRGGGKGEVTPIRRVLWRMIIGSLVVIAAGIGGIRATEANEFWLQQGYIVLMLLGTGFVIYAWRQYSKSN